MHRSAVALIRLQISPKISDTMDDDSWNSDRSSTSSEAALEDARELNRLLEEQKREYERVKEALENQAKYCNQYEHRKY
uniref:CCDC50_N domain-containing protein n=1 Tax=Panagrellus redivivus TaxID=6233 RepID=A0A7E4VCW4_PANRE